MDKLSRRDWMSVAGAAGITMAAAPAAASTHKGASPSNPVKAYELPPLQYAYDALEPYLDAETLKVHHDKHHQGYVNGLNSTLDKMERARGKGDMSEMQALSRDLAFHGSGHVLHTLYFSNLSPDSGEPAGRLQDALSAQFGGVDKFMDQFKAATAKVAGSGWGLLAYEPMGGRLVVLQVEKHENQLVAGCAPLLVIDVWEHAYYLKYRNKRGDYIDNIMKVVDWKEVGERLDNAVK